MDTCEIGVRLYQHTSVDDCIPYGFLGLYYHCSATNRLNFIDFVIGEVYFFNTIFSELKRKFFVVRGVLIEYSIWLRQNKPISPHLNEQKWHSKLTLTL